MGKPDIEKMKAKGDIKGLIKALKEKDDDVRKRAAWALVEIGELAVGPLIKALEDKNKDVRSWAAGSLGEMVDARAIEPLIKVLEDKDEDVRNWAAGALIKIGEPAVGPLIQAMKDKDEYFRSWAAGTLAEMGKPAVEPLIETLKDDDVAVRNNALGALIKIGEPAVEPLIRALEDESKYVRNWAAQALREIGDAKAAGPLTEALIEAMKDKDKDVRNWATGALGEMGEPAVEPLVQTLKDKDEDVRRVVAKALGKIEWKPKNDVEEAWYLFANNDLDKLVTLGKASVEPLIEALKNNKDYVVRKHAAEALGKIGDEKAVEPLLQALKDRSEQVRKYAAEALGKTGDERAVEPLIQVLKDEDWDVKFNAAEALGKIGEPAVEPLIQALKDKNADVRKYAAGALGKTGDERAVEPLTETLKDRNKWVRESAAEALENLNIEKMRAKGDVGGLVKALKDKDEDVRGYAAEALENMGWQPKNDIEKAWYMAAKKDWEELIKLGSVAFKAVLSILDRERQFNFLCRLAVTEHNPELIPDIVSWVFASPKRERDEDLGQAEDALKALSPYSNLSEENIELLITASSFEIIDSDEEFPGDAHLHYHTIASFDGAIEATKQLCALKNPLTTNLLHMISQKKDITVQLARISCAFIDSYSYRLSFAKQRSIAAKELERRGFTGYDPSVYFKR